MKFDPKLTQKIADWLNTPEADRDIHDGATLMLSLNRNRALYNSILRNPARFRSKLEYELRKHLRMRLDGMSAADVVRMEAKVIPSAEELLGEDTPEPDSGQPDSPHFKGRRADHDSLPPEVKALWDDNGERFRRIRILFAELKNMASGTPCDRYEKLVILDRLERAYRSSLELYDNWHPGSALPGTLIPGTPEADRAIAAARKTLSKYRSRLARSAEPCPECIEKISAAATTIASLGGGFTPETRAELAALGVDI